jgi:hypothetical protein
LKVKDREGWFGRTDKDYLGTGYYFTTTVYRFVAVSTWIHRFEAETFYVDSRIAEQTDFDFLSATKLLQKAATDVTLFKGMDYDDFESKDHFFSDTLRTIADSCWKDGRFLSLKEFESKIVDDHDLDPVLEFFDDLKARENRLRWDRLVVFHLLLVAFINTFGYKFQETREHELTRIAGKIEHTMICENLISWLREYEPKGQGVTNVLNVMEIELRRRKGTSAVGSGS